MKYILLVLILCFSTTVNAQDNFKKSLKKCFRFSTFYGAVNGGNSISDVDVYSVSNGLQTSTIKTPYDYNVAVGVRKIARFGYENRAAFYDGNEKSWSDGANVGKVSGLEFLFELDYKRQQGQNYLNQHHFIRYVGNKYIFKGEYLEDGFANIKYFETSERYRHKVGNKLSFNVGAAQRLSEPYGYDPLNQWLLPNGDVHYTYLALQEGYTIDFDNNEYKDPNGNVVATNPEIWTAVVVPEILKNYTEKERGNLNLLLQHSVVIGFDFYHYKKDFWVHAWGNVMPYHYNSGNEYSYHKYNNNKQWYDYSGGLIFGYKFNKNLGTFVEGKYNKYWNREWYNFKLGINYIIF
tara:strand:- start:38759 stop:39808 length:1050 start_codon:yes stop_codon:yes gene_type:complete